MKPHRSSLYATFTGVALGLMAAFWWSRAPDRMRPAPFTNRTGEAATGTAGAKVEGPESGTSPKKPVAHATVQRIRDLLATLEPVLPGETENKTALELLHWWTEIDPASAIAYAQAHPALHGRAELSAELFIKWLDAQRDPAIAWATTLPPGALRSGLLPAVISVVAETRPLDALTMASELEGENRRLALSSLFTEWSTVDPVRAAEEAQRLPTTEEQNLALRQVIGKWADQDLAAAIAWAKRLPPASNPGSLDVDVGPLEILLEKWIAQAPIEAAQYLATLPQGTRRIQMLSTAASQWAEQNPRDALAWATGLADAADRDVALRGVLSGVAQTDIGAAANLALTLPPGAEQRKGMELIIDQWSARAPDALMRWATAQALDPSQQAGLPAIVNAWAGADLSTLGDWLSALPSGDSRDVGCAALAGHLAPTRPDEARHWAESITDPLLRQQKVDEIAGIQNRR